MLKVFIDSTTADLGGMLAFAENLLPELVEQNPFWEFYGYLPESMEDRLPRGNWSTIASDSSQLQRIVCQQLSIGSEARRISASVGLSLGPVTPILHRKVPWVEVIHDWRHAERPDEFSLATRAYRKFVYSLSLSRCAAYACVSKHTQEVTKKLFPWEMEKPSTVIYHGVDHISDFGFENDGKYVLAYGHRSNKRPEIAVRLWAEAVAHGIPEEWRLKIVGLDENAKTELRNLISELGIGERTDLLGYCADDNFEKLRAGASLQIITSSYEGFGLPVLEALAGGQVVFATAGVGMEEAGGSAAIFLDWADMGSSAAYLARAISDSSWRQSIVSDGIRYASQFTWAECARNYSRLLESVARGRQE